MENRGFVSGTAGCLFATCRRYAQQDSRAFSVVASETRRGLPARNRGPSPPVLAGFTGRRDACRVACPFPVRILIRPLALVMVVMCLRSSRCLMSLEHDREDPPTGIGRPATPRGRPKEAAALAAYERLKPVLDAGAGHLGSTGVAGARDEPGCDRIFVAAR